MKRLLGETTEALDLCHERGIISDRQHWCGIHLRWLYTLRHGAPSPQTMDITNTGGCEIKNDDQQWRTKREKEYNEAINLLTKNGQALLLLNLCVYNQRPKFLGFSSAEMQQNFASVADNIARLRDGLDILSTIWKKPT